MTRSQSFIISSVILALITVFLPTTSVAEKAPEFTLPTNDKDIQLSSYKNQVVYVDFWASWCTPCKQSFPWMNEMQTRYKDRGFKIIAVNLDDSRSAADTFLSVVDANFTIAYDPQGKIAQRYGLTVMPTSYLINRKGDIHFVHKGFRNADRDILESKIKELVR